MIKGKAMGYRGKVVILLVVTFFVFSFPNTHLAEEPIRFKFSRSEIEEKWEGRIRYFLDQGVIPLIGLLSFLRRENSKAVIRSTKQVMDKKGVALISFAGYWAPKEPGSRGHRWDYFIHRIVNADPDYFILTTNKGSNKNWFMEKSGKPWHFIDQLEQQVRGGDYAFIGQIEFRHYMSGDQCRAGKNRDIDIPLNGDNGHRVFQLSSQTGVPFSIHLEPEDKPLDTLEEMLATYPKAKVIISHFGQIRHPERETKFGPKLVERLLSTYPNLYYDLSTGNPGRYYRCNDYKVLDTVIWEDSFFGGQKNTLKVEYKNILTKFSNRFVVGFDYGPPNRQSKSYLEKRIKNIRLIMRNLPDYAKHNIGYRNAWFLLTGKPWE
jgi:hypothetical protein